MNKLRKWTLILIVALAGYAATAEARTDFSFSMGTDDFYLSVGDYDYYPYTHRDYGPPARISFYSVLSDYGYWVYIQPFGRVWRPYASYGWRPYVYGHWVYTSYGPTWQGYEPWAWVGYHYGNWIWSPQFGWVWVPGYDWHPGNVVWSQGYGTIGWMPAPPSGYDYCRGYLHYHGDYNQFTYYDEGFGRDDDYYGGPYYDSRYRDLYYNPSYTNVSVNLWVFIRNDHFNQDSYANHYLDRDYTRNVFSRRVVKIQSKSLDRSAMERVVKQSIREVPVEVRELETEKKKVKMVVPVGQEERIRRNANTVVREVIAPAFAEKQKSFKGLKAKNEKEVSRVFQQENVKPKIQTVRPQEIVEKAKQENEKREIERVQTVRREVEEVTKYEKQRKEKEPEPQVRSHDDKRNEAQDKQKGYEKEQDKDKKEKAKDKDKDKDEDEDEDEDSGPDKEKGRQSPSSKKRF